MLERYTEHHRAPVRRPGPAAYLSIAAHVAALVAILVYASWRLDKLDVEEPPLLLATAAGIPMLDTGDEPRPAPKPKPPKRRRVFAQPDEARDEPEQPPDDAERDGDADPTGPIGSLIDCPPGVTCDAGFPGHAPGPDPVCGNGRLEPGEECDDGAMASGDGCSPACRAEVVTVPAKLIEGHRISGESQIRPPDSVQAKMMGKAERRAVGTVHLCVDRAGAVRSLRVLRSTGYDEYDQRLISRMRDWRYRPYRLSGGAAVPVCTAVTFIFQIR